MTTKGVSRFYDVSVFFHSLPQFPLGFFLLPPPHCVVLVSVLLATSPQCLVMLHRKLEWEKGEHRDRIRPRAGRSRHWSDVATSQGLSGATRSWTWQGRSLPWSFWKERVPADTLSLNFWPPDRERRRFCCFKLPRLWSFFGGRPWKQMHYPSLEEERGGQHQQLPSCSSRKPEIS